MLAITIPKLESYNEAEGLFVESESYTIQLEHSLASISKWESEFEKPFLGDSKKTVEETLGYIRAMNVGAEIPEEVYHRIPDDEIVRVNAYLNAKMTATWFVERPSEGKGREIITSEVIYYWMTALNIPWEAQFWHFNRLLTTIKVANEKNAPAKKRSRSEMAADRRRLVEQRRAQYGTRG